MVGPPKPFSERSVDFAYRLLNVGRLGQFPNLEHYDAFPILVVRVALPQPEYPAVLLDQAGIPPAVRIDSHGVFGMGLPVRIKRRLCEEQVEFRAAVIGTRSIDVCKQPPLILVLEKHGIDCRHSLHDDRTQLPLQRKARASIDPDLSGFAGLRAHIQAAVVVEQEGESKMKRFFQARADLDCSVAGNFQNTNVAPSWVSLEHIDFDKAISVAVMRIQEWNIPRPPRGKFYFDTLL